MDQDYRVIYLGRLRRGQTRPAVAGRLSEALGRDRAQLEKLLAGAESILLCTPSGKTAQQLAEIFSHAGAEVRLEKPGDTRWGETSAASVPQPLKMKPAVRASLGQRLWLMRAALVLLVIITLAGLGFGLAVAGFFSLLLSYGWVVGLIPVPALVLPIYISFALLQILVVAGLVKPFVPVKHRLPHAIKLERDNEPDLFDFLVHICDIIQVPYPRAVYVDMSPMVKAGLGPHSELTIGLPILAVVTSAELGGLVARALTLHINGISGILGRFVAGTVYRLHDAVHGRDLFDRLLERGLRADNRALVFAAREFSRLLEISRGLLAHLLKEAVGTSAAAMKAIEGHADRHQARIVGAERFGKSVLLARLIRLALDHFDEALRKAWHEGRSLPEDLPAALGLRLKALAKPDMQPKALALAEREQEKVPPFHVADAKRIDHMVKSGIEPALFCGVPARSMVRGYAMLSRRLTMLHYWNRLNLPVTTARLQARAEPGQAVLEKFAGNIRLEFMPVVPGRFLETGKRVVELVATTETLKRALPSASEKTGRLLQHYRKTEESLFESMLEELYLRSRRATRRHATELEHVQDRCRALEGELDKTYSGLTAFGEFISRRIAIGVTLLGQSKTARWSKDAPMLAAQATALAQVLGRIQQQVTVIRELSISVALLERLLARSPRERTSLLKDRILELEADIGERLTGIRGALRLVENPLREDRTSLLDEVLAGSHATGSLYEILDEAHAVIDGILRVKIKILTTLATLTEAAENALVGAHSY